jgi:hypothetical protein
MIRSFACCLSFVAGLSLFAIASACRADGTLLGVATIPGDARDLSGLTDELDKDLPHNRLGGFSAIDYTGQKDRYCVLADRGPGDGAHPYACRVHFFAIAVDPAAPGGLRATLASTQLLQTEAGTSLSGSTLASAVATAATTTQRFDPEGLRLGTGGALFISEEYAPAVAIFNPQGRRVRDLPFPAAFVITTPGETKAEELRLNARGRWPNKGPEGLAITPSGRSLFVALQGPLIQDAAPDSKGKLRGTNVRIVEFDLKTGRTRQYLYPLDSDKHGISEMLAVGEEEFLFLERDGAAGEEARFKKVIRARKGQATDVSRLDRLPPEGLPAGVIPFSKTVLLDLLDSRHGLAGASFLEKIEGLTFGPTLPDGRRLLLVCADNDFLADQPSQIYAFAIPKGELPGFGWKY